MALCILLLKRRVHYLPVITVVFIIGSVIASYGISVGHGHVEPIFPYISHTANKKPERCIFAQLINIGAFLLGLNVFVRYLQQKEQYRDRGRPSLAIAKDRRLCIASLVVGWLSALGISIVANFQTIDMRQVHWVGAGLAFVLGLVYCWLQTSLSLRQRRIDCVTVAQVMVSVVLTLCLMTFVVSKSVFKVQEARGEGTKEEELRPVYLASTISEWCTAASAVVFLLTFYRPFSSITLQGPRVLLPDERMCVTLNGTSHPHTGSHNGASSV